MSLRTDGSYRCDRCNVDVGNAAVTECAIITDLDPDDAGELRYLHLCRAPRDGAPNGCVGNVFGDATLAAWTDATKTRKARKR